MRWGLRAGLAGVLLAFTCVASTTHAQSDRERAAARQAAKEGIGAFQKENWEDALKYLERAESVVHAPTHLLFIARANVKLGKFLEAREAYQKLINENLSSSAPKAFHNAQAAGREEIKELEGRLAKVTIELVVPEGEELEDLKVTVGGDQVPSQFVDLPVPANPGEQTITATAKGMLKAETVVTVEEGGAAKVTLELEVDPNATQQPVAEEPEEPQPAQQEEPKTEVADQPSGSAQKAWGWVSIGTGVALGAAGGVLWLSANSSQKDISGDGALCQNNNCTADGIEQINQAKTQALVGDIAIGAGAVALGIGAVLLATAKKPSSEVGIRSIVPTADSRGGYLTIQGGF